MKLEGSFFQHLWLWNKVKTYQKVQRPETPCPMGTWGKELLRASQEVWSLQIIVYLASSMHGHH
jgi:hypothetical protein